MSRAYQTRNPKPVVEEVKEEKKPVSPQMVIGGALLFTVLALAYSLFVGRATIRLVSPQERAALSASDLSFKWSCSKDVPLVLEVYDGAELVLRQFVNKDSYTPDDEQKAIFQADRSYRWRIIPNPDMEQKYRFNETFGTFYITSAIARKQEEEGEEDKPEVKSTEAPQQAVPDRPYNPNSTEIPPEGLF